MIVDKLLTFGTAQPVTTTALCTDKIDLGVIRDAVDATGSDVRDIGAGEPLNVWVQMAMTATGADTGTLTIDLLADDDSALGSPQTVQTLAVLNSGDVESGGKLYHFTISPLAISDGNRYIGLKYTVSSFDTSKTISAGINASADKWKVYPKSAGAKIITAASS